MNFYWRTSKTELDAITGVADEDRGLVLDASGNTEFYVRQSSAWVAVNATMFHPQTAIDNTIPRFDGTSGKKIQASGVAIDDDDNLSVPGKVKVGTSAVELGSDADGSLTVSGPLKGQFVPRVQTREEMESGSIVLAQGEIATTSDAMELRIGDGVTQGGLVRMLPPAGNIWTPRSFPIAADSANVAALTYGNGMFLAIAGDLNSGNLVSMASQDGISWYMLNSSISGFEESYSVGNNLAYGNGLFLAVIDNAACITSADGKTWSTHTMTGSTSWQAVAAGAGKFVAVASNGTPSVAYSTDGTTWTTCTGQPASMLWSDIAYGNGKFVAVANTGVNQTTMYSTDGITWTPGSDAGANVVQWTKVVYGNGRFVALASSTKKVGVSYDGINWTITAMTHNAPRSVGYGNGLFIVIGEEVSDTSSFVQTSVDGLNWSAPQIIAGTGGYPTTLFFRPVCANGVIVAQSGSAAGAYMTSGYPLS